MNATGDRKLRIEFFGTASLFIAVFLIAQSAVFVSAQEPQFDRILTLEDSVKLALDNSQALLTSREDVNIALQRVREAESFFYPRLDLNANWSKFSVQDGTPLLLQPGFGSTLIPNNPQQNFYTTRANIYQTVYEGGRVRNTWRQARILYERARSVNESMQNQVVSTAKAAFYDLLLAQEKVRQYDDALQTMEPLAKQADDAGIVERINMENELSSVRASAAEATLAEENSRLAYLRALNLELNTTVQLKGQLETHPLELDLQKMLAWASEYRSELRQTEYQQELDSLGISLSLAERNPTVAFGATYERAGTNFDLNTTNWAGTLNVNLPVSISDMIFGWAKVRERRAEYRQATLKHAETADLIQLQVREAYAQYRFWQEQLNPRDQSWRRMLALVQPLRERQGMIYDKVVSERMLLEAHLRYEEAVHGHLAALAAIEQAVGRPLDGEL